jgi:cytochrome c5
MRKIISLITVALAASLLIVAVALAAHPKLPSKWSGGNGKGAPVAFNLNKSGKATYAMAVFNCHDKSVSGIAGVQSKHPSGKVSKSGKLTITFSGKVGVVGKVKATLKVTFTSKTAAKVAGSFSNPKCGKSKLKYTATAS